MQCKSSIPRGTRALISSFVNAPGHQTLRRFSRPRYSPEVGKFQAKMPRPAFLTALHVVSGAKRRPMICRRCTTSMKRSLDANGAEFIRLDTFIKLQGAANTGGHAKMMITGGEVVVNGDVETRRGRKLRQGDSVAVGGVEVEVVFEEDQEE